MVPTYKRIKSLKTLIDSVFDTVGDNKNVCWTFCINKNDVESSEFLYNYFFEHSEQDFCIVKEETIQPNLSKYFNQMYDETLFKDAVVTEIGDDMIFKTKDWDTRILAELNRHDGLRIVYCNDDFTAHERCCVNLFTSRELVERTKKPFMCEFFHADMIDVVWTLAGVMSGLLTYFEDIKIFHNHNTRKKSTDDWDDTFKRLNPIQRASNSKENHKLATCYATIVARNLIESGIGKWNVLQ